MLAGVQVEGLESLVIIICRALGGFPLARLAKPTVISSGFCSLHVYATLHVSLLAR